MVLVNQAIFEGVLLVSSKHKLNDLSSNRLCLQTHIVSKLQQFITFKFLF